ncbi:TPA: hypothetical protein H1005_03390 [archaeon]|uniref:Uncharacterized protein n=1 Tax=Candidatus Naiadarchaeum limnaeum TaxID=2756139 RepID=A0A832XI71_9ARCH|nr:hypothetical protein [Candidatus Naiadarchaeales archaeon SRR2090153.bin1042]HIK00351.1 hypothetical protein [Candidatus Naiadarchaeum limnaeum]
MADRRLLGILKGILQRWADDWPTPEKMKTKLPPPYSYLTEPSLSRYFLRLVDDPLVGKRAFRAANMTLNDKAVLFAIREGKRGGELTSRSNDLLVEWSPKARFQPMFDTRLKKLKKLATKDEEIKAILEKGGYL